MENKIVAIVNGVEITERDLEETLSRFPRERQGYLRTEEGKKQLVEQIVSFELIYNYAKEIGLEKDSEYLVLAEKAKKEILTQVSINKLLSEVSVDDKEVEEYYNANKEYFKNPESATAKHILVDTLEKATEIAEKISNGLLFEEAAMEYSSCPSKAQGGSLGAFSRGQMVPEFEEAAFTLPIGQISEPVKTQFGYHLIIVENRTESSCKEFSEVKDAIKNKLLQERQNFKYMQITDELKTKYNVVLK